MKIAILGIKGIPGHHGVEVVVDSLVPHLVNQGHEITVYGYESYTMRKEDYKGAAVKSVAGSSHKNFEMISHMWNASLDTRSNDFDIIHIHNTDPCLLCWLPKAKYGVIATSHGQAYLRKKWSLAAKTISRVAERFFMYMPDIKTSVSKPLADYYMRKYHRSVEYIPNGITFREKPDSDILRKWNLDPHQFLFCSAGRIEQTKGLHTLLEAYAMVRPGIPLIVAGGGSGTDPVYFEKLKREKPEGVRFIGFLTGDDLYALYAYAKIFVFPSEYEAMSMALLEGLSFGTPTLYSNIEENDAVAEGLAKSFLVSDKRSLSENLTAMLNDYGQAKEIGEKAKSMIRKNHNWEVIASQYADLYKLLKNNSVSSYISDRC